MVRRPGLPKPSRRGRIPARVVNIQTKKPKQGNKRIRLDQLNQLARPVICVQRKLGGIGDVLMTTPLITTLKTLMPHCHVVYCTDLDYSQGALGDIIRHNPYIDQLISNEEFNDYNYDYTVDLTATGLHREKSGTIPPNRIDLFAEEVGVSISDNPLPIYNVTEEERKEAIAWIKDSFLLGDKREDVQLIAVQARSNDARRTWNLERVQAVCKKLSKDPKKRVLLLDWGHDTKRWETHDRMFLVLDRKLPEVAALMEQCDLVICPDSSNLHLAGALGKKIVTIFGPIPAESRVNYYSNTTVLQLQLSCGNCWYTPRCVNSNISKMACFTGITPEMVVKAAEERLATPYCAEPLSVNGADIATVGKQDPIILVKRSTAGIGDLVMATNGIEALKIKYPRKKLHVAVPAHLMEVLKNNPYIDEVIDARQAINMRRYHVTIDISTPCARYEVARIKSGKKVQKNRVEIFAEALGTREMIKDIRPKFYLSDIEREKGLKFLEKAGCDKSKPTIGIVGDSAELYRDWPKGNYIRLANFLIPQYNVVIFNKDKVDEYEQFIHVTGQPFRKAISILVNCDGLITVDTGMLHIAEALDIKTIALFGPIDYVARCKGYKYTTVMTSNLPCIPCWRNSNTKCKENNLIKCYSRCMETIQPKHVLQVVKQKIKRSE